MQHKSARVTSLREGASVEMQPGIVRTTMAYNEQLMVCHFALTKGAVIPLHNHTASQSGFVLQGKVRLFLADESSLIAARGDGYVFDPDEPHGAEALEDTELIECFSPLRPEYL